MSGRHDRKTLASSTMQQVDLARALATRDALEIGVDVCDFPILEHRFGEDRHSPRSGAQLGLHSEEGERIRRQAGACDSAAGARGAMTLVTSICHEETLSLIHISEP